MKTKTLYQPFLLKVSCAAGQHTITRTHLREMIEAESQDGLEHLATKGLSFPICMYYH